MKHTLIEKDVFEYFVKPGEVTEIRAFISGKHSAWGNEFSRGIVSGYFDDHPAFCAAVKALDALEHGGIYFTLQVIDPRLIGRAFNRLAALKTVTSDRDVLSYRWLPIDLDPVRPAGIPASDTELAAALTLRDSIADEIQEKYKLPLSPIKAVSGNGGHLLYPIIPELPAAKYAPVIKQMLEEISEQFSTDTVNVDSKVFNPARIWKLYGTTAKKGDQLPVGPGREARPHRLSYIDLVPLGVRP
jgi:hypothetical protein